MLFVSPPSDREDLGTVNRAGWRPADDVVRLSPVLLVTGVVRSPDGSPVPDAFLWVQDATEYSQPVSADAAGRCGPPVPARLTRGGHGADGIPTEIQQPVDMCGWWVDDITQIDLGPTRTHPRKLVRPTRKPTTRPVTSRS